MLQCGEYDAKHWKSVTPSRLHFVLWLRCRPHTLKQICQLSKPARGQVGRKSAAFHVGVAVGAPLRLSSLRVQLDILKYLPGFDKTRINSYTLVARTHMKPKHKHRVGQDQGLVIAIERVNPWSHPEPLHVLTGLLPSCLSELDADT